MVCGDGDGGLAPLYEFKGALVDDDEPTPVELIVDPNRPGATADPSEANHRLELAAMRKLLGTPTLEERVTKIEIEILNLVAMLRIAIHKEP